MIEAFSTPGNRIKAFIFLTLCGLLAIISVVIGIDDNPPGALLAFLSACAFILAFVHPWRSAKKFMFLLLAALLGFVLFIILSIITDSLVQNPTTPGMLKDLLQSPAFDAVILVFAIICPAAFIVGVVGSLAMFIRNRRKQ